jgi:hypothetical protein
MRIKHKGYLQKTIRKQEKQEGEMPLLSIRKPQT